MLKTWQRQSLVVWRMPLPTRGRSWCPWGRRTPRWWSLISNSSPGRSMSWSGESNVSFKTDYFPGLLSWFAWRTFGGWRWQIFIYLRGLKIDLNFEKNEIGGHHSLSAQGWPSCQPCQVTSMQYITIDHYQIKRPTTKSLMACLQYLPWKFNRIVFQLLMLL